MRPLAKSMSCAGVYPRVPADRIKYSVLGENTFGIAFGVCVSDTHKALLAYSSVNGEPLGKHLSVYSEHSHFRARISEGNTGSYI